MATCQVPRYNISINIKKEKRERLEKKNLQKSFSILSIKKKKKLNVTRILPKNILF